MNCQWAEGQLSAYLDGALDPTVRADLERHIEQCSACSGMLAEFRYFDGLVRDLPRFEPSEGLRARIFDSPEFAEILRSVEAEAAAPTSRWPVFSRPAARPRSDDAPPAGHDRPLEPLPFPAPAAPHATPAGVGRRNASAPPWAGVAAAVAAAIVVLAGSALLLKQGLTHSVTANRPGITSISAYQPQPALAAGPRVVYLRDGALWSAPERGGAAQQLTPAGVVVGEGWVVSPSREAIAYIDETTGELRVIASNDQHDHRVGTRLVPHAALGTIWASAEGQAILAGLAWSSDSAQIAYLSDPNATGLPALHVARADGSRAPVAISPAATGAAQAAWSPDGTRIAWVRTDTTGRSVWDYNLTTNQVRRLGAAGPAANATVRTLAWLGADQGPAVTWVAADPTSGLVTGVYVSQVLQGTDARLITGGQTFTAAAFSPAAGGLWLLSDGSATYVVAPLSGTLASLAGLPGAASITWSPDGALAALVSPAGDLHVWARTGHIAAVASGVSVGVSPAWSPDGGALAFVSGGQLVVAHLIAGASISVTQVPALTAVTALAWSPDGTTFAAGGDAGLTRGLADGTALAQVDAHALRSPVVWSLAR
jgi:anti-sigma factor RsiW